MADPRAPRRLAAILAADVVGYSRLMERDENGTLAALKARRKDVLHPTVSEHKGRIFKVSGDGVRANCTWEWKMSFGSDLFRKAVAYVGGNPAEAVLTERDRLRNPDGPLEEDEEACRARR